MDRESDLSGVTDTMPAKQMTKTSNKAFVMDPKELPISQPRTPKDGPRKVTPPEWLADAPKGAYFSPILLVKAGIYKSQVAAQVALRNWSKRGILNHEKRGVYHKTQ